MAIINQKTQVVGSAPRVSPYFVNRKASMAEKVLNPANIKGMMM